MHNLKSFRNVSDPTVHQRVTSTVMQKINTTELCQDIAMMGDDTQFTEFPLGFFC